MCVIHSGIICEGHKTLNRCLHNVSVIEAKAISEELISQYDIICVDEAQRLYKSSVDMILSAYETGAIRGAILRMILLKCYREQNLQGTILND